jgi:acyl-CoA synthetase (AMP-forming)/AMP-acid ligase II
MGSLVGRPESGNGGAGTARIHDLKALLESATEFEAASFPAPRNDQAALILYTSGSTGEPKGAVHRQADIFYTNRTFCAEVLKLTSRDRLFSSSRLPFAYGLGNSLSFPLLNGATDSLSRNRYRKSLHFCCRVTDDLLRGAVVTACCPSITGATNRLTVPVCGSVFLREKRCHQLGEEWEKTFG